MNQAHENQLDRILTRVRDLLALAEDQGASDNERMLALERAQRLMDRHAIAEWQLEQDEGRPAGIEERFVRFEPSPVNRYRNQLAATIAHANRCKTSYQWRNSGNGRPVITGISVYGTRSDIEKTLILHTSMELCRSSLWRIRAAQNTRCKANASFRNSYYQAFQDTISERYQQLEHDTTTNDSQALTLARSKAVEQYMTTLDLSDRQARFIRQQRRSNAAKRAARKVANQQPLGLNALHDQPQRTRITP